jgi:two-component system OmpR family response regulator
MPNTRHKVLVIDDERAIVSLHAAIFESQGYETATAYSGEEAVEVADSFRPDCIVSDITMGAMSGVEAAIEILSRLPQCKVLFISGNASYEGSLEKARAKGFHFEALEKPAAPREVLARIAKILPEKTISNRTPAEPEYPPAAIRRRG